MIFDPDTLEEFFTKDISTQEDPKYLKYKLRKIWYEHVKRRPSIDKMVAEKSKKMWDISQQKLPPIERRDQPTLGFLPEYSPLEQYIFSTPIEKLMEDYQKTLNSPL